MKKLAFLLLMVVAFVTTSMAQVDTNKMYRLKDNATSQYLTALNYVEHAGGTNGGVGTSALAEDNEAQIFIFEQSGSNYKIKTKTGYYIYAQAWNVDALSSKSSEFKFTANGTAGYYMQVNNTNKDPNGWYYVKNEAVGSTNYLFGDAAVGAAATWTFEEVAVDVPSRTITVSANNDAWGTVSGGGTAEGAITITATPADGYKFVNWTVGGVEVSTTATFTDDTEGDKEYVANFELDPTLDRSAWTATASSYEEDGEGTGGGWPKHTIDGNTGTFWHSDYSASTVPTVPHWLQYNLGSVQKFTSFNYVSRNAASENITCNGNVKTYKLYVSNSDISANLGAGYVPNDLTAISEGDFVYDGTSAEHIVDLGAEYEGQYVFLLITDSWNSHASIKFGNCSEFYLYYEPTAVTPSRVITVEANPVEGGTVTGGGESEGAIAISATANEGYRFVNWTLGPDEVTTSSTYTDNSEGDKTYTANFVKVYNVTATAENGNVTISGQNAEGTFDENSTATLTVTPNNGYLFTNWTLNGSVVGNATTLEVTVTADAEYVANFEKTYCTYSGNSTQEGRYLSSFTLTDGTNQVAVSNIQTAQSAVYVDKTTSVLTTYPGATLSFSELNWTGTWMHGYVFIDYNNDKEFNGTDNNNGTTGGELVTYSAYTSSDGNTFKDINGNLTPDSDGSGNDSQQGDGGNGVSVSSIPSWTLPADLAPGNYRLRFNIVWNTKDACGYADMATNGGAMVDITLTIASMPSRQITVSATPAEGGTVTANDVEGSITTDGIITIKAEPAEGYKFVKWTLNGEEVSTATTFVDNTEGDKEYVAEFALKGAEDKYAENICTPGINVAGNTTFVSAATISEGVNIEDATIEVGDLAVMGQKGVTAPISAKAGATFNLNLTYTLNWGDLAIFGMTQENSEMLYGPFEGSWVSGGSTSAVLTPITEAGLTVNETTVTYPIAIPSTLNVGDIYVVRALTGVDPATACDTGIAEGGYIDFLFDIEGGYVAPIYAVSAEASPAEDGQVTISATEVEENETVTLTATANEGYEFVNWTVGGTEVSTENPYTATITAETAFVANFQAKEYTITYIVDGEEYETETYDFGAAVTPVAAPTKEGYTFSGWSEVPATMPANDVEVTGTFTINNYTITYIVDGEEYETETYDFGATVTPVAAPTKEGYTFSGWSEIPATMPANDVEVTGTFTINNYTITYIVDGEEYETDTYDFGAAVTPEAAPTKEGYTFSGWSEIPATMPANDVEVTGTFTINNYTITYTVDGEEYATETYDFGAAVTAQAEPTKEGYTFSGWSEIPATMPANDVEVTGTFTVNSYTITYKVDGEVYTTETYDFGATVTPVAAPVKAGYTFSGWSEIPATMPANDVEVTGTFTATIKPSLDVTTDSKEEVADAAYSTVTISNDKVWDVQANTISADKVSVSVDADGVASEVKIANGGQITTVLEVTRTIEKGKWALMSLPFAVDLANVTVDGAAAVNNSNIKVMVYDAAYRAANSIELLTKSGWKDLTGTTIAANQGFAVAINASNGDEQTVIFTAASQTYDGADKQIALSRYASTVNGGADADWNFYGNPTLAKAQKGTGYALYVYNAEDDSYDEYASSDVATYQPYAAWFVQSADDFNAMSFSAGVAGALAEADGVFGELQFSLNDDDEARIVLVDESSEEYVRNEDALYFPAINTNLSQLYLVKGNIKMAVSEQPSLTSMAMGYKAVKSGEQTLTLTSVPENTSVVLVDNVAGTETSMTLGDTYTFQSEAGTFNNRFVIETTDLTGISQAVADGEVKVLVNGTEINVYGAEAGTEVVAYTTNGTVVASAVAEEGVTTLSTTATGVIVVKVANTAVKVIK